MIRPPFGVMNTSSWLACNQRDQQLHKRRVQPNSALTGTGLRGTNVKLRLAVAFPGLVDPRCRRLGEQVHIPTVSTVASPNLVPVMTRKLVKALYRSPIPSMMRLNSVGEEHRLVLRLLNGWQLHAPAGVPRNVAQHLGGVHRGRDQAMHVVDCLRGKPLRPH